MRRGQRSNYDRSYLVLALLLLMLLLARDAGREVGGGAAGGEGWDRVRGGVRAV